MQMDLKSHARRQLIYFLPNRSRASHQNAFWRLDLERLFGRSIIFLVPKSYRSENPPFNSNTARRESSLTIPIAIRISRCLAITAFDGKKTLDSFAIRQ